MMWKIKKGGLFNIDRYFEIANKSIGGKWLFLAIGIAVIGVYAKVVKSPFGGTYIPEFAY